MFITLYCLQWMQGKGLFVAYSIRKELAMRNFLCSVHLVLLPAIEETGKRVITYDNLSSHTNKETVEMLKKAGHYVVPRLIHSPDFSPVEVLFCSSQTFSSTSWVND